MGSVVRLREEDIRAFQGVAKLDVDNYFAHTRTDIVELLPAKAHRILEIGCSQGGTLRWLRKHYGDSIHTTGVDGWEGARHDLESNADRAIIADLNGPVTLTGEFNLILALDILEHLEDPVSVLQRLVKDHLAIGGDVIVSLPNFANWKVWWPLVFQHDYVPEDQGIKDRTHRHFTTPRGAVRMLNAAGLRVIQAQVSGLHGRRRMLNKLTGGLFKHWLGEQVLLLAVRSDEPQRPVVWGSVR